MSEGDKNTWRDKVSDHALGWIITGALTLAAAGLLQPVLTRLGFQTPDSWPIAALTVAILAFAALGLSIAVAMWLGKGLYAFDPRMTRMIENLQKIQTSLPKPDEVTALATPLIVTPEPPSLISKIAFAEDPDASVMFSFHGDHKTTGSKISACIEFSGLVLSRTFSKPRRIEVCKFDSSIRQVHVTVPLITKLDGAGRYGWGPPEIAKSELVAYSASGKKVIRCRLVFVSPDGEQYFPFLVIAPDRDKDGLHAFDAELIRNPDEWFN